jgi:hypothetical protein
MSQIDMLENQVLEEILRERANYYFSKNKNIDFWLLISPNFLKLNDLSENIKQTNFYKQQKSKISSENQKDYYSCIVSLDKEFILWLQLRLGYFETINSEINEKFVSDGVYGFFDYIDNSNFLISPLKNNFKQLNPSILIKKYKKTLQLYNLIV